MAHDALKEAVWRANLDLVKAGLVILTWGNVSGADRAAGVMAIKPSGVAYDTLRPDDIVVVSLETGEVVDGVLRPSSDTPTHLLLYRDLPGIGGVAHTHSSAAVSWAQAERDVPCLGTTHADHFHGCIPVTRRLRDAEVHDAYERNTGAVIVECFRERGLDPLDVPGALVAGHGPFAWGESARNAVENAIALEATARMALDTLRINPDAPCLRR
jgi:L-ribulose-5-phosphate 4-epimerase